MKFRILLAALAVLLAGCFAPALAAAEGAEPYGDGDGIVSREQLAGLYNWIAAMEYAREIAFAKNHPLFDRRYMGKITY